MLFYLAKKLSKYNSLNENKLFEIMYIDIIVNLFLFLFSCPLLPNIEVKQIIISFLHS